MPEPSPPSSSAEPADAELVAGEPVAVVAAEVQPAASGLALEVSGRQVAALAATGFVAGAATAAVIGRRAASGRRRRKRGVLGEVVSSNSFLVDVHVLKR